MLSGELWPAHPHPFKDELFSCWLVRLIHANGLKIQTFCDKEFNKNWQLWNRDIDRLAPDWLIEQLSKKSGSTKEEIHKTTLLHYHGVLFDNVRRCGELKWVMPLGIYHRTRKNYGLQFCPICLREDEPYFRKTWRLALYTFCQKHNCMLHEKCPACESAVIFQRTELGKPNIIDQIKINKCWKCDYDYSLAPINLLTNNEPELNLWKDRLETIEKTNKVDVQFFNILHQFCKIICSVSLAPKLEAFICHESQIQPKKLMEGRISLERRSLQERHYILMICNWLANDWRAKLASALSKKAVRYNHLLKDFDNAPISYNLFLQEFNRNKRS